MRPLLYIILFKFTVCSSQTEYKNIPVCTIENKTKITKSDIINLFKKVQEKYDTLIPIFDGLFITHNKNKWGVIDSIEKKIIPFKYDGIKIISDTIIIASLPIAITIDRNTQEQRYDYVGTYIFFTKTGLTDWEEIEFELHINGYLKQYNNENYSVERGPSYYTPDIKENTIQKHSYRSDY